eukprot:285300_1
MMLHKSFTFSLLIIMSLLTTNVSVKIEANQGHCLWKTYATVDKCDLNEITVPGKKALNAIDTTTKAAKGANIALSFVGSYSDKMKKIVKGISLLTKVVKFAGPAGIVIGAVGDIITLVKPDDNALENVVKQVNKLGKQLVDCVRQEVTKAIAKQDNGHFSAIAFDINLIVGHDANRISAQIDDWSKFVKAANRKRAFMKTNQKFDYYEQTLPAVSAYANVVHFGILDYINALYECAKLNNTDECNPAHKSSAHDVMNDHQSILKGVLKWAIEARDTIYYHYKFAYPVYAGLLYRFVHRTKADPLVSYSAASYKVKNAGDLIRYGHEWWPNGFWPIPFSNTKDAFYMVFAGIEEFDEDECHVSLYYYDSERKARTKANSYLTDYYDDNYAHSALLFYQLNSYISQIKRFINYMDYPGDIVSELILIGQDMDCEGDFDDLGKAENIEDCEKKCIENERKNPNKPCMFFEYGHQTATLLSKQKQCYHLTDNCKKKTGKTNWYNVFARVKPVTIGNYKIYKNRQCSVGNENNEIFFGTVASIDDCIQLCYAEQISNGIHCKWVQFVQSDEMNSCSGYPNYDSHECAFIDRSGVDLIRVYDIPFIKLEHNKDCRGKEVRIGKTVSVEICADVCAKDPSCQYFLYSTHKDRKNVCYLEYNECNERVYNEHYDLYAVISLIGKGKKCSADSVDLDNKLYISPESCYMDCMAKGGTYIAFGNEQKSEARQCTCYEDAICTEIDDFNFDLYSTKKSHIACPELYDGHDENCCYGYYSDKLNQANAEQYCNQMDSMTWVPKDYSHHGYTCCQMSSCPAFYTDYDENCCYGYWGTLNEATAKKYCNEMDGMVWIHKDYSHHGYTCCKKGTESISYYDYYQSWYYEHFIISNILISSILCSLILSSIIVCKQCNSSEKKIKYNHVNVDEDKI